MFDEPTILVPFALFGWIPVVFALFVCLKPTRAVVAAYIGAWLFLPMASYPIQGLPDYSKMFAASVGVLLATAVFDFGRFASFRLHWIDIPMIAWCLVPCASSLSNGLGLYDGCSSVLRQMIIWGLPYFTGRMYFNDLKSLRVLAIGIVIGGLLYVPLCLIEVRLSPQLHRWIYGYHQHRFTQAIRFGGYRPLVFMQNGLAVAMWMAMASFVALWLWRVGGEKRLLGFPLWILSGALVVTTVLCKSLNGVGLLGVGVVVMFFTKWTRSRVALVLLMLMPLTYMYLRATQTWSGRPMLEWVEAFTDEQRARSLDARLTQEDLFSERALERPFFGWGGYGRMFPTDELSGKWLTRGIDSLWIIALGTYGLVGLISVSLALLLPLWLMLRRSRADVILAPSLAVPVGLAILLVLHMCDCLYNGLVNPVFVMASGGVGSFVLWRASVRRGSIRAVNLGASRSRVAPGGAGAGVGFAGGRSTRP